MVVQPEVARLRYDKMLEITACRLRFDSKPKEGCIGCSRYCAITVLRVSIVACGGGVWSFGMLFLHRKSEELSALQMRNSRVCYNR